MRRSRSPVVLLAVALAVLAAGCGGGTEPPASAPAPSGSIRDLKGEGRQLSLLQAQASLAVGTSVFSFGLVDPRGNLLRGGAPEVYIAKDETSRALGPFPAAFHQFTAYDRFDDESPRSPLNSFYTAEVEVPEPGKWAVAAVARGEGGGVGTGFTSVVPADRLVAAVGSEAKRVETPVARTTEKAREICTRTPEPDPLHYISLDDALANGKPTVISFATPLLCESQMCGPVVDEVWAAYEQTGRAKANFIHVEVYLPGPDLEPPPATVENVAPAMKAFGFTTEPITLVIDGDGVIRARLEGPVVAVQILEALRPLL